MRAMLLAAAVGLGPMAALAGPADWEARLADCRSRAETEDDLRQCKQTVFLACMDEASAAAAPGAEPTCQAAEAAAWDAALNGHWREVKAQAEDLGLSGPLLAAQKAWLAFRDSSCTYDSRLAAATGADAVWQEQYCLSDLTAERVIQFRLMLSDG